MRVLAWETSFGLSEDRTGKILYVERLSLIGKLSTN